MGHGGKCKKSAAVGKTGQGKCNAICNGVNTSLKNCKFTKKYTPIKRQCFALQNNVVPDLCNTVVFPIQRVDLRTERRSSHGEPCLRGYC